MHLCGLTKVEARGFFQGKEMEARFERKNKVGENSQQEAGMTLTVAGLWLCLLSFHDKLTPAPLPVSASLQQKIFHTPYTLISLFIELKWRKLIHYGKHSCREKMGKAVGKNQGQNRSPFGEESLQSPLILGKVPRILSLFNNLFNTDFERSKQEGAIGIVQNLGRKQFQDILHILRFFIIFSCILFQKVQQAQLSLLFRASEAFTF